MAGIKGQVRRTKQSEQSGGSQRPPCRQRSLRTQLPGPAQGFLAGEHAVAVRISSPAVLKKLSTASFSFFDDLQGPLSKMPKRSLISPLTA